MQAEERNLITGLFERIRPFESQPRDAEAERLIGELVARQPSAPYLLTQTVLVQEQALKAAQARLAELEGKASQDGGGFLASAPNIGPWGAKPAPAAAATPTPAATPAPGPWSQGGGFLHSALSTAAGIAGGMFLFEGIRDLFGRGAGIGQAAGPWGLAQAAPLTPLDPNSPLMPPDNFSDTSQGQLSSVDLAQDDGAADDYDQADDNSGFDGSNDI